jgi:hypothetical protein
MFLINSDKKDLTSETPLGVTLDRVAGPLKEIEPPRNGFGERLLIDMFDVLEVVHESKLLLVVHIGMHELEILNFVVDCMRLYR